MIMPLGSYSSLSDAKQACDLLLSVLDGQLDGNLEQFQLLLPKLLIRIAILLQAAPDESHPAYQHSQHEYQQLAAAAAVPGSSSSSSRNSRSASVTVMTRADHRRWLSDVIGAAAAKNVAIPPAAVVQLLALSKTPVATAAAATVKTPVAAAAEVTKNMGTGAAWVASNWSNKRSRSEGLEELGGRLLAVAAAGREY
jgi:cytoskeletal protein RodZ